MKKEIRKARFVEDDIIARNDLKKRHKLKVSFKGRWELFVIGWKYTRKFPDYSLWKALKDLFIMPKMEYMRK